MNKVKVKIQRFDPDVDEKPRFETYEVPRSDKQMVLHAIQYIQDKYDPTIAIRWNCRAGKCGSCSCEINGKPKLACKTEITDEDEIVVTPLKVFPVIKDLVTDVSSMWKQAKEMPPFQPKNLPKPWEIHSIDVESALEFKKCIECFLCQDVCHVLRDDHNQNYIGPRWLVKAGSLDKHPIDEKNRSSYLEEKDIWSCNVNKCCQDVCPEGIKITDNAIIPLKEKTIDDGSIFLPLINLFRKK